MVKIILIIIKHIQVRLTVAIQIKGIRLSRFVLSSSIIHHIIIYFHGIDIVYVLIEPYAIVILFNQIIP